MTEGSTILWQTEFSKAGELATTMQRCVSEVGMPQEIVVGIGPGSYTGLRVAAATAIGLSLALGCPMFGCPSVLGYNEESYWVIGDARRDSVFLATVERGELVREPELLQVEQFHLLMPKLVDRSLFAVGSIPGCDRLPVTVPHAIHLVRRRSAFRSNCEPLYLKEPHITQPTRR